MTTATDRISFYDLMSGDLRRALDRIGVIDSHTGEEVVSYAVCYLAVVQTLDGTLPASARLTIEWGDQRAHMERLLASMTSEDRRALWDAAIAETQ